MFAKTSKSAARISELFKKREVSKYYICVVNGHVKENKGVLHDLLIQSNAKKTLVMSLSSNRSDGVSGILRYSVIRRITPEVTARSSRVCSTSDNSTRSKQTVLAIELETGRKHQIR